MSSSARREEEFTVLPIRDDISLADQNSMNLVSSGSSPLPLLLRRFFRPMPVGMPGAPGMHGNGQMAIVFCNWFLDDFKVSVHFI